MPNTWADIMIPDLNTLARRFSLVVAVAAAPLLFAGSAHATAMFSGSSTVSLTITGIENLTAPGGALDIEILGGVAEAEPFSPPIPPETFTAGTGTASATATLSPMLTPPFFDDPAILDEIREALQGLGYAKS